jgi:Ca2+-binding EF-hand superfamily protein
MAEVTRARTSYEAYIEDHLHRMHHEIEVTTRKLELEKRRLAKLEEDCRRAKSEYEDKVMPKRKHDEKEETSVKPKEMPTTAAMIKAIEYKLDKAIGKFNLVNHENKDLRERIDEIRRERIQLNQVFRKSIEDIRGCTKGIFQIKSEEDDAKNVVEDIKVRISALAKQRERGRKGFGEEVERLKIQTKKEDREKKETEVKMKRDADERDKDRRKYLIADEELNFSEATMMKRILKLAFLNTIQRRHIKQHQKNIEIFEQAFATIKSTTGISDIEEIVKIFVKLEERNFSLLTYVNQLNREIEALEKRNKELDSSIKDQRQAEEDAELRRRQELSDLDLQIQRTQASTQDNLETLNSHTEILTEVKPVVMYIAEKIDREGRGHTPLPREGQDDILSVLTWIETALGKWREYVPEREGDKHFKPFPCTVSASVKALAPKRFGQLPAPLLRQQDLPSANFSALTTDTRGKDGADSDSSEEDYESRPWSLKDLREKTRETIAKRKLKKRGDPAAEAKAEGADAKPEEEELGYDDLVEGKDATESSDSSDTYRDQADPMWPTDDEVNEIFLKRYKMTKEELQAMADRMGIQLNNLCYLKQEFDAYDQDRSGCIDRGELKGLLEKLGEELTDEELDAAFKELDADGSGEIEFFEFVEWFTSD